MSANRYTVAATTSSNALSLSKTKGTPSVKIAFRSIPTEEAEQPRTLFADLWLTDAAFDASVRTLREVFRWEGDDLSELNSPILQGIEVDLVCEVEAYTDAQQQPREREVVKFVNLPGAGGVKALDGMDAANLCASLNAKLAGLGRQATAGRQGSARHAPVAGQAGAVAPGAASAPQHGLGQGRQGSGAPRSGRGSAPSGADDFPGFAPPQEDGEY